jgi:hypothetical protein
LVADGNHIFRLDWNELEPWLNSLRESEQTLQK